MIAHGRFYVADSSSPGKTYKWDIANGYSGVVVTNIVKADGAAERAKSAIYIIVPVFVVIAAVCLIKIRSQNKKVEFLKEEVKKVSGKR